MARKKSRPADLEPVDDTHPSQDRTNRRAVDQLIRSLGWQIHSRPRQGANQWRKGGVVLSELEVLDQIDPNQVWDAEYLERLYAEGFEQ